MKKFLSMILALTMIMALIPAVSATEEAETATEKTYEFSANEAVKAGQYAGGVDTFGTWGWKVLAVDSAAEGIYKDKTLPYGTESTGGYNYRVLNMQSDHIRLEVSRSAGTGAANAAYSLTKIQVAFALEAPVAGFYKVESKGSKTGELKLYLGKNINSSEGIEEYITDVNAFYNETINYNTTATTWDTVTRVALDGIIYSDAVTELAFAIDTGSSTKYLRDLHLTKITPDITYTVENDTIGISAKTDSYVTATWTEDEAEQSQKVVNSFVTYKSSNENVATVSELGIITGVAKGTATITATVGGVDYTKEITVAELSGVTVEYETCNSTNSPELNKYTYNVTDGTVEYFDTTSTSKTQFGYFNYGNVLSDTTLGNLKFIAVFNAGKDLWTAYKIRIPKAGDYVVELLYGKHTVATDNADMYLLPVSSTADIETALDSTIPILKGVNFYVDSEDKMCMDKTTSSFTATEAGEYYMVWKNNTQGKYAMRPARLTLDGGNTETPMIYADITLGADTLEVDGTTTLTQGTAYLSNGTETTATGITYKSTNEAVAKLENGTVTAVAPGVAKIQALREDGYVLDEETITVNTPEYTAAFGDDTYTTDTVTNLDPSVIPAAYAKNVTLSQGETTATDNEDGTWAVKTPEKIDDCTFRYWVRGLENNSEGNKRIVSLDNNFTYSPEKGDANYLIAVYTDDSETQTKEYFNANGQLITDADENTRPYMHGYGYAKDWKDNGNGIYEAVYGEKLKYKITVNGVMDTYEYGTQITCPTVELSDGEHFLGWKKTVGESENAELVSTDMNYSFYAWENCKVEPLIGSSKATFAGVIRKIVLSSLAIENDESVIMAEFIGFENAIERGITLGSKDYTMTNKAATQFTIINDVGAENISGYAILADGTKYIYNYSTAD